MGVIILVECDCCAERFELAVDARRLKIPTRGRIMHEAARNGRHIGRLCICPDCLRERTDCGRCSTCKNWRNKLMETPSCELDGELALDADYCDNYDEKG